MNPTSIESAATLRRRRSLLLLWSALPVLLVLCFSAKMLSLGIFAGQAARAFDAQDAGAAESASAGLRAANFIETHKAAFAEGDSLVLAADFAGARQRFEQALALTGPKDECVIRVNLVLSIERLGDARLQAEDPTAAGRLFAEGLAAVGAAPQGCFASGGQETGEKLKQAEARLQQKFQDESAAAPQPQSETGDPQSEPGPERQSQFDQLKDSARQSQLERSNGQERDDYLRDSDYGSGPDKPW
ncbi:hypothetical protein QFZ30_001547 [Arthrobacter pascens]|uniref:hypothetical protein n=1 Tax=Arthrobacter pascens TaxID=1677 RepID=UPI002794F4A2|nr:hypothetical protein [Arthrobacter pascens]MDQ0678165.1 hypothetical protein [Arthrobacter pascens]